MDRQQIADKVGLSLEDCVVLQFLKYMELLSKSGKVTASQVDLKEEYKAKLCIITEFGFRLTDQEIEFLVNKFVLKSDRSIILNMMKNHRDATPQ
jgi:hypothetical protein